LKFIFAYAVLLLLPGIFSVASFGAQNAQDNAEDADQLEQQISELYHQGRYLEAIPIAQRELEIRKRMQGENTAAYAMDLHNLSVLYQEAGQYDQAEQCFKRALEIRKMVLGENHPAYAATLNGLALLYKEKGQYQEAERRYQQALEIWRNEPGENDPIYATGLYNLAELYRSMGRQGEAERHNQKALEIWKTVFGENHPAYARGLMGSATLYKEKGQYQEAERRYQQALEIWRNEPGENDPIYATGLYNLALLYQDIGQYREAERRYQRALEIRKRVLGKSHPTYATSLTGLAGLYADMGQYGKAEPLFNQALEIQKRVLGENHPAYATSLNSMAGLNEAMGQYAKAESLFIQAGNTWKRVLGENHPVYVSSLINLASLYQDTGQYGKAEPLFGQALETWKSLYGENHPDYANGLNNLGVLYQQTKRYEEAERCYRQALEIQKRAFGENHPDYANGLNNLALLHEEIGRYEEAEDFYEHALKITGSALGTTHPQYAKTLANLARLYAVRGQYAKAEPLLDQALRAEEVQLRNIFGFTSEPQMQAYLSNLSSLQALLSLAVADNAGTSNARHAAVVWMLRRKAVIFDALSRFQQAERLQEHDPDVAQKMMRLRELKQHLHTLALNPPKDMQLAALQQERNTAAVELERIEAELNRTLSRKTLSRLAEEIGVGTIQRHLPTGAALVDFLRTNIFDFKEKSWQSMRYFALVIRGGGEAPLRLIDLGEAEKIDQKVKDARERMTEFGKLAEKGPVQSEKTEEDNFRNISVELYRAIFTSKVKQALGSVKTLYVAPDGQLNQIAFESLVDETGKYLVESYRLVYLTAGRDLLRRRTEIGKGTVVFAAPDYNLGVKEREGQAKVLVAELEQEVVSGMRGIRSRDIRGTKWDPLKGAAQEATDIHKLLNKSQFGPVRDYPGPQALEEVFLGLHSPRILHVATHGYFLPDQEILPEDLKNLNESPEYGAARGLARLRGTEDPLLRSGLVFAGANLVGSPQADADKVGDGWVTAEEVSLMDLRGTELVVLSACESGLGAVRAGDGVQGLRRAFLLAGARSLVMSLYKVPDVESAQLMQQFYRNLKAGKDKASAMQDAELQMMHERRKNGAAHPFFWASFIFLGDPN